jgi:hypothetical protein
VCAAERLGFEELGYLPSLQQKRLLQRLNVSWHTAVGLSRD